eukprot:11203063-Ditylum_brightwellii.AAC.1
MCFMRNLILGAFANSSAPVLSLNALQCTLGVTLSITMPACYISSSSCIIRIPLQSAVEIATYSASHVLNATCIWSLEAQIIGHPA